MRIVAAARLGAGTRHGCGRARGLEIGDFGSLENLYANLDGVHEVKCRGARTLAVKLDTHREAALLARRLTGIACDAPLGRPLSSLKPDAPDLGAINALFDAANIGTALRRQAERVSDLV